MSVSIADMERVALGGAPDDIGNVIELGDLNDDLGLSMLANPNKVSVSHSSGGDSGARTVNINAFAPPVPAHSVDTFGGIDISPLEPISLDAAPIDMGSFGGPPVEVNVIKEAVPAPSQNSGFFGGLFGNSQSSSATPAVSLAAPQRDPEADKKEKSDYLNKLQRLEQKGFPVARRFTMDNNLEEIKTEYFRLVDARQLETSIKFQRQMLMGAITGLEWMNGRFDPFDLKLDGWSEQVHENVEDFDEIFEELYDKYKDRGKMSPEMRLIMAVGGSGFMCHVSNSFFRSKMPSMDDVLRKNPELARQMAAAAAQSAGPGFGNFMGAALGVQPGMPGMPGMPVAPSAQPPAGFPTNAGPAPFGPTPSPANPTPNTGAFFGASAASPMEMPAPPQSRATARREMTGPTGVEDILRTFEEVSRAEMAAASMPQPATGFATQPAVAAAMNSAASVISAEEMMSQAESSRTGATGGRRRRRTQAPVGNTIALNV